MGQKVNPIGIRLGIVKDWNSKWYAKPADYAKTLVADLETRRYLEGQLKNASVSKIAIERTAQRVIVTIYSARPGVIIGKKGSDVEVLREKLTKRLHLPVHINIEEIRRPELDSKLVAQSVAQQLERRIMFRRAMKRAVQNALRAGAKGIKIKVSGRLGGAEIARSEWYREGRVPLHTLRADIDYGTAEALTTYGIIGVKVWIFKGEVMAGQAAEVEEAPKLAKPEGPRKPRAKKAAEKAGESDSGARKRVTVKKPKANATDKVEARDTETSAKKSTTAAAKPKAAAAKKPVTKKPAVKKAPAVAKKETPASGADEKTDKPSEQGSGSKED